jgi:hypothetical protein
MIIEIKYFYEKTDEDYEKYQKLIDENKYRMIFLHIELSYKKQLDAFINDIDLSKDILFIHFPKKKTLTTNKIIKDIMLGHGFKYNANDVWYPKEVWIYNPSK